MAELTMYFGSPGELLRRFGGRSVPGRAGFAGSFTGC
jgi:hypothetical protein